MEIDDEKDVEKGDENENKVRWRPYQKKKEPIEALEKVDMKTDIPPQSVLFVQYTENGELAARIREVIMKLKPWTGINFKVIERVGEKLEDTIHKSNPWDKTDCMRSDCFTCKSAVKMSEPVFSSCKTRSVVYRTWCQTCKKMMSKSEKKSKNVQI